MPDKKSKSYDSSHLRWGVKPKLKEKPINESLLSKLRRNILKENKTL